MNLRYLFLIFNLLIISNITYALEIMREGEKIYLSDTNCGPLQEVISSLEKWATIGDFKCEYTHQEDLNSCNYEISKCLPYRTAKFIGLSPKMAGPNCHNLALVMAGILPSIRYTHYTEVMRTLNPPLCKELTKDEEKLPGDIGRIGMGIWSHSFTYLSDSFVITKNGLDVSEFKFQKREDMLEVFQMKSEPITYYRCISTYDYLKGKKVSHEYENTIKALADYENKLECRAIDGNINSLWPVQELAASSIAVLAKYLQNEKAKLVEDATEEENLFLLESLNQRFKSLEIIAGDFDQRLGFINHYSDDVPEVRHSFQDLNRAERTRDTKIKKDKNPNSFGGFGF